MRRQVHLLRHYDVAGAGGPTDFDTPLRRSTVLLDDDREVRAQGARRSLGAPAVEEEALEPQRLALLYKSANTVGFEVELAEPAFFLYTDLYHPGFRARVDGHPVPLLKAMGAFKAVELAAGTHRVEFVFAPVFRYALVAYLAVAVPLALAAAAAAVRTLTAAGAAAEGRETFGA
jgi:hypothetical protein